MSPLQGKGWVSKTVQQIISTTEIEVLKPPVSQSKETTWKIIGVHFNKKIFSLKQFCSEFEEEVMDLHPSEYVLELVILYMKVSEQSVIANTYFCVHNVA